MKSLDEVRVPNPPAPRESAETVRFVFGIVSICMVFTFSEVKTSGR